MTEREKMLAGQLYDASDPELEELRLKARRLTDAYNKSAHNKAFRQRPLRQLLGSMGEDIDIQPPFYCDYGVNIHLGDHVFMNFNCVVLDCAEVHIGSQTMFGPAVQIYTASHPLDAAKRAEGPELAYTIRIGSRVWIGGGAIICPGVTIGDDTTIGAGSVVTKDIPSGVFAAGNPCRVIKEL